MNNIDEIRLEIERLKEENRNIRCQHNEKYCTGYDDAFNDLLAFIDSLPDEIPPYCTGFKGDPDPPGISYLEEAAEEYAIPFNDTTYGCEYSYKGFIAGAKWQAKQLLKGSPLPEDTVLFQKGVEEGRRLEKEEVPRWKKGPADSAIRTRDYWPVSNAPMLGKPETRDYFIVKRGKSMLLAIHAEEGDYYLSTEELDKIPTE